MITEDQLEQLCLEWFLAFGYGYACGYDIAPDSDSPERSDYRQIVLFERLLERLRVINPHIPGPVLIRNNKAFHRMLLEGIINNSFAATGKFLFFGNVHFSQARIGTC